MLCATRKILGLGVLSSLFLTIAGTPQAFAQRVSPQFRKMIFLSNDGTASLTLGDKDGIITSMGAGDPESAEIARRQDRLFWPDIAAISLDRMSGNVVKADHDVSNLRTLLRNLHLLYDVELLTYYIDVFDAGDKILHQDLTGWITAIDAIRHHYTDAVRRYVNMPQLRLTDLEVFEPDIPVSEIPHSRFEIASKNTLPYVTPNYYKGQNGIFTSVPATIKGKRLLLSLSSGSFIGDMPIEMAHAGGYPVIGHTNHVTDSFGRASKANYVVLDQLTIGESSFHNVIFRVMKTDHLTVGMDFLMQLPKVTMTRNTISFGSAMPYQCRTPIHLSMDSDGTQIKIVFPVVFEKKTQFMRFASGIGGTSLVETNTLHFTQKEQMNSYPTANYSNYGLGFFLAAQTPFNATLYGQKLVGTVEKTLTPRQTSASDFTLSAALLGLGDVSWDFASRTACFVKK